MMVMMMVMKTMMTMMVMMMMMMSTLTALYLSQAKCSYIWKLTSGSGLPDATHSRVTFDPSVWSKRNQYFSSSVCYLRCIFRKYFALFPKIVLKISYIQPGVAISLPIGRLPSKVGTPSQSWGTLSIAHISSTNSLSSRCQHHGHHNQQVILPRLSFFVLLFFCSFYC